MSILSTPQGRAAIIYNYWQGGGGTPAENLSISGDTKVASLLSATYDNEEATDSYTWYRADNTSGLNESAIGSSIYPIYKPGSNDIGKYLRVKVTKGGLGTYSSYTSVVTSINLMEDDFNHGTVLDTSKWTVVNPSGSVTLTQKWGVAHWTVGTTVVNLLDYIQSKVTIPYGTVAARISNAATTNSVMMALQWNSTNRIHIRRQSGNSNAWLLVTNSGNNIYNQNVNTPFNGRWKIRYDSSGDIYFYKYNVANDEWDHITNGVQGTPNANSDFTSLGNASFVFSVGSGGAATTGWCDDVYITSEDYPWDLPEMFRPPSSANAMTDAYQAMKLGWFIHDPYNGEYLDPAYDTSGDWSDARTSIKMNWDFSAWAAQAAATNVDYVLIHVKNARGFRWWDNSDIDLYPTETYNGVTVPQYGTTYTIASPTLSGLSIDENHIQTAIDAFVAQGLKVGFYYNIGLDINYRTAGGNVTNIGTAAIYQRFDEYCSFVEREAVDLINKFTGWHYFWMDGARQAYPRQNSIGDTNQAVAVLNYQRLYQKMKLANSNIMLVANFYGPANGNTLYASESLDFFPVDVISAEIFWKPTDNSELSNPVSAFRGNNYYIPKELSWSGLYRDTNTIQYPWLQQEIFPSGDLNKCYDQTTFQTQYDLADSLGVPFAVNVPVKHDGTFDSTTMTRIASITL